MRVLVTGGAGYIGSHVARALARAGHTCVALDDLSTGHAELAARAGAELVRGDVADPAAVARALAGVDAVVHMAGRTLAGESVLEPLDYWRTNVGGPVALLEGMRAEGVRRLVVSSSCAVYGTPAQLPVTEACPTAPISPYGETKLATEWAVTACCRAWGLRALQLRYFNVAGAADEGDLGEVHEPEHHLIPTCLKAAAAGAAGGGSIRVNGTDFPTRDGTCERDYLHVEDVARAHVAALERLDELELAATGGPINLGAGRGATVREVIAAVERITGLRVPAVDGPRRPGDPTALVADAGRAAELLGWRAERDLDDMVRSAWAFERARRARSSAA